MAAGRFQGRVAVVTGSSADPSIGRACATRLGREGASVVINGRSEASLQQTEKQLGQAGYDVVGVAGSMEDDETPGRLVKAAVDHFGRIDFVVNTVGGTRFQGPPLDLDRDAYMATISLNTWPSLALIQEAMRHGLEDGGGAVVNISSGTVHKTTPTMASYAAAKAALNALTRTLARELAPRGVRVNGVAPGLTKTDGTRRMWESDGGSAAGHHLILGRITEAADIANAAVFLLSDDAAQITGVTIDVDGGNHLMGGWSPVGSVPAVDVPAGT